MHTQAYDVVQIKLKNYDMTKTSYMHNKIYNLSFMQRFIDLLECK